jgi:sarcosine oxidase subunit beta
LASPDRIGILAIQRVGREGRRNLGRFFVLENQRYDAIIIGSGIIGCATAFELAQKGYKTLNVDRLPSAGYGSTSNSCGVIRVHYSTLDGTALAYEAYYYWKNWAEYLEATDEQGLADYKETGCMVIKTQLNDGLKTVMAHLDELGFDYEEWDADQIKAAMPVYDTRMYFPPKALNDPEFGQPTGGEVFGAMYYDGGGYVGDPALATHNLQRAAEAKGAEFIYNRKVTEIHRADGRAAGVTLDDGRRFDAPVVVNCAGPHSFIINRLAGVEDEMNIKTKALRVEVAHVPSPANFEYEYRAPVISDGDIGCYSRPEVGNHILVGSEDPECDPREYVDPDDYNQNFTDQWTVQAHRMGQRIPELPIPNQPQGIVDLYDCADDWIPIYDKSGLPGFYMAIGTSGNQFKNAPVVGKMMAELIEASEKGHDHDRDPVQFHLENIGRTISIGFFSRNREINPESSFSVLG